MYSSNNVCTNTSTIHIAIQRVYFGFSSNNFFFIVQIIMKYMVIQLQFNKEFDCVRKIKLPLLQ